MAITTPSAPARLKAKVDRNLFGIIMVIASLAFMAFIVVTFKMLLDNYVAGITMDRQAQLEARYGAHFTAYQTGPYGYAELDNGNCGPDFGLIMVNGQEMLTQSIDGVATVFSPAELRTWALTCPDKVLTS